MTLHHNLLDHDLLRHRLRLRIDGRQPGLCSDKNPLIAAGPITQQRNPLTDDDLGVIEDEVDEFAGPIPERSGIAREEKEMQVGRFRHARLSTLPRLLGSLALGMALFSSPVFAQAGRTATEQRAANVTTTGTVVSSGRRTMIVRTEGGQHMLFSFEGDTIKPSTIPVGSSVTTISRPDQEGVQVASSVTVTAQAPKTVEGASTQDSSPIPPEVRTLERQIERQVRRFRAGVRAGAGLDPEVLTAGVHAKLGPFLHRDVFLRPNAEFGFGEVTTLVALNFEAVYRLPITERQSRWSVYIGAGPGFNFIDRDFEEAQSGDRDIDLDDFDFEGSLNFLAGVEFRSGMFLELKSTTYSRPQTRLLIGYSF